MSADLDLLSDEDAERLARILLLVDPTPPEVYAQARARFRWALELRSGGVPVASRPDQTPAEEDAQGWESGHRSGTTQRPASADGLEGRALSSAPGQRGAGGRAAAAASPHHELPGGAAVPESAASLGHQTPGARDGAAGPWASARPVRTTRPVGEAGDRAEVAGAVRDSGRGTPEQRRNAAPARLTTIAAGVAAFLLLIPLAVALGLLVGDLALLYLP